MIKVLMISTFGPNTRGISPYADKLAASISLNSNIEIKQIDYKKAFPSFLLPNNSNYDPENHYATIDYKDPRTWNVLKDNQYDVVHLQYWSPAFIPILIAILQTIKKYKTSIVITWHNPSPHENLPFLRILERKLASYCDCIICHTQKGKHILEDLTIDARLEVVHHGCEIYGINKPTTTDYKICGLSNNNEYILFFGNIRPYKGLDILLDAWKLISHNFPQTKLIIAGRLWEESDSLLSKIANKVAGTSSYSKKIREIINNDPKDIICDFQFIPENKVISYLKISKLAVFPYRTFESQSGAAALAAGYGLPFVTSNAGGLKQLAIDESFIVSDISVESLANTIAKVLLAYDENYRTKQLIKTRYYSWDKSAEFHAKIYNNLLN